MKATTGFWHFARGMALAGKGRIGEAEAEYKIVTEAEKATSPDAIFQMPVNNKTKDILKIAENVLGAQVALAKKDNAAAVEHASRSRSRAGYAEVRRASGLVLSRAGVARRSPADQRRRESSGAGFSRRPGEEILGIRGRCLDCIRR